MSGRVGRVQRLAKQILGELIHELKDPRVGFATVTAVRISADLQHGRVFVSVLGTDEEQADTMAGLKSAAPYLRGELGRQMRMKYLPELVFELDTGAQEAERLESLLHQIEKGQPAPSEDDAPAGYPPEGTPEQPEQPEQ